MNACHARNLGLDLVRTTEASALAAGRYMGLGQADEANLIAAGHMRAQLDTLEMRGHAAPLLPQPALSPESAL
jgi:fructose-1,6-bisphosphatase/sedoheptulose 1,7-bisphosphatase-like protein